MNTPENRQRYIAFVIRGGSTDRGGMISAIRDAFTREQYDRIEPWLTVFDGREGIVRVDHMGKEEAVEILNSIEVGAGNVETLVTSGTIKNAREGLFEDG